MHFLKKYVKYSLFFRELNIDDFSQVDLSVPEALLYVREFGAEYWKEMVTTGMGVRAIKDVISGSHDYDLAVYQNISDEEADDLRKSASKKILYGNSLLLGASILSDDIRLILSEMSIVLFSFRTFLKNYNPHIVENFERNIKIENLPDYALPSIAGAGIMGSLAYLGEFNEWYKAISPVGLAILSVAINLDQSTSPKKEQVYQLLSLLGGSTLIAGSALDFSHAKEVIGKVMSSVFITLNTYFIGGAIRNLISKK